MIQRRTLVKAVIAALAPLSMTSAFAAGGPSGAHIGYQHQGQLGAVDMNPYKIAPLTAIIRDAGFTIQTCKSSKDHSKPRNEVDTSLKSPV